ncbi:MAG: hypothetical protein JSV43_02160, partial [Methanobacteriota archaeon]
MENGFSGQARWKSVLVVALLVFTAFFAVVSTIVPVVKGYATPGSGVFWTMDDLVANSGGAVTGGGGMYQVHEDLLISGFPSQDYLIMLDGDVVSVDAGFEIVVEGVLFSYGFVAPIEFNSNEPSPEASDWAGITFNRGSFGRFAGTTVRHARTGITVNNADVWVAYSFIRECYPYGIYYNGGVFQLNSSFVFGSSPPSGSISSNGGTAIYATGPVSDILWLNQSWIIGGNGNPSGPGGPAVFALDVVGPIGVIGNTMIVGGMGGYNSVDGGMAGAGGIGLHFFPITDTDSPRGLTISNNLIIAGGAGGLNNASFDGMSGQGGNALMITDDNNQGTVLISNNSLTFGGWGGLNEANWSAGFMVGGGGAGASIANVGGLKSALWNNSLILGGQGGNNTGSTIMPGASAGPGGNAVQLMNSRDFLIETNWIIGGHGGNNTWPGFGVNGGIGGIGLWMGNSINVTVNNTPILGGEGGDDWVGMVGPGMMAGPGNGYHALSSMDVMGSVTNCYVQGGEGGDNFGTMGQARPGGYAVNLMGPSPFFSDSTFIGGKGGDNYNDSGFNAGNGYLAFYISDGMRSIVTLSDIIGGSGGHTFAGANAIPGSGSGAVFILGNSRRVNFDANPIITVGAGGTNFVTAAVGPKGDTVMSVGSFARQIIISGNLIYNGSQYGIFNQAPGLSVDGNRILSNNIGINLEPTARWTNITNNVGIAFGQEG